MLSKYLGDKPFWKSVTTLALPMALQALLSTSFTLVDTVMVGQLGDISLSAVGMAGLVGLLRIGSFSRSRHVNLLGPLDWQIHKQVEA